MVARGQGCVVLCWERLWCCDRAVVLVWGRAAVMGKSYDAVNLVGQGSDAVMGKSCGAGVGQGCDPVVGQGFETFFWAN